MQLALSPASCGLTQRVRKQARPGGCPESMISPPSYRNLSHEARDRGPAIWESWRLQVVATLHAVVGICAKVGGGSCQGLPARRERQVHKSGSWSSVGVDANFARLSKIARCSCGLYGEKTTRAVQLLLGVLWPSPTKLLSCLHLAPTANRLLNIGMSQARIPSARQSWVACTFLVWLHHRQLAVSKQRIARSVPSADAVDKGGVVRPSWSLVNQHN
jgi:hypothetical protein